MKDSIRTRLESVRDRWEELEALLAHRQHLVALDLAGDEVKFPAQWFTEHFRTRDARLHKKIS